MQKQKYDVFISPAAEKQLKKLNPKIHERIIKEIVMLKDNPRPIGTKKLTDTNGYRIRIGNYRVLYIINDSSKLVEIYKIGDRKEIYR